MVFIYELALADETVEPQKHVYRVQYRYQSYYHGTDEAQRILRLRTSNLPSPLSQVNELLRQS